MHACFLLVNTYLLVSYMVFHIFCSREIRFNQSKHSADFQTLDHSLKIVTSVFYQLTYISSLYNFSKLYSRGIRFIIEAKTNMVKCKCKQLLDDFSQFIIIKMNNNIVLSRVKLMSIYFKLLCVLNYITF